MPSIISSIRSGCVCKYKSERLWYNILSVEIPDAHFVQKLFGVVTNMIYGSYENFNMPSPCTNNKTCIKRFPKDFLLGTITVVDETEK